MYNEKKEMEKINFGDLPVDWEDEEFAEEYYEDEQLSNYKQKTQNSNKHSKISKLDWYDEM